MALCMGCMEQIPDHLEVCPLCGYVKGTEVSEVYYLKPGTVLQGHFVLGKVLGHGGFGVTYIGYDNVLQKKIAVKEYFPSDYATRKLGVKDMLIYSGDAYEQFEAGLDSFIEEARKLAVFSDVSEIVRIYDCFKENRTGYIVMEYLKGQTVKELLAERKQFPYAEAESIIMSVLNGLIQVHKENIVHRDIAPDNIFITENGAVKILDFGASRYAASIYTRSLSVILKPGYAPEEQYRSYGEQGPWTDVYGVGATFYRMITGIRPPEALERMVEDELQPPSELGVEISPKKEAVLLKSLGVLKENRIPSAEEFKRLLLESDVKQPTLPSSENGRSAGQRAGNSTESVKTKQSKRWIPVAVIAGCCLAGVVVLGKLFADRNNEKIGEDQPQSAIIVDETPMGESETMVSPEETVNTEQRESESESSAQSEAESVAQGESESVAQSEAESQEQSEEESNRQSEAEENKQSEAKVKEQSEAESIAQSESEEELNRQSESEAESNRQSELEAESNRQSESEAESNRQSESEAESNRQSESEAESNRQSESEEESNRQSEQEVASQNLYHLTVMVDGKSRELQIHNDTSHEMTRILITTIKQGRDFVVYDDKSGQSSERNPITIENDKLYNLQLRTWNETVLKLKNKIVSKKHRIYDLKYYNLDLSKIEEVWLKEKKEDGYLYINYRTAGSTETVSMKEYATKTYDEVQTRYVLANGLRVRRLPNTDDAVGTAFDSCTIGEELQVCGTANGFIDGETAEWYLIRTDSGYGFISARDEYSTDDEVTAEAAVAAAQRAAQQAAQNSSNSGSYSGGNSGGGESNNRSSSTGKNTTVDVFDSGRSER